MDWILQIGFGLPSNLALKSVAPIRLKALSTDKARLSMAD